MAALRVTADAVAVLGGLGRCLGGVRFEGEPRWRWDPAARRLSGPLS